MKNCKQCKQFWIVRLLTALETSLAMQRMSWHLILVSKTSIWYAVITGKWVTTFAWRPGLQADNFLSQFDLKFLNHRCAQMAFTTLVISQYCLINFWGVSVVLCKCCRVSVVLCKCCYPFASNDCTPEYYDILCIGRLVSNADKVMYIMHMYILCL